jgi:hypothetical protein
MEVTMKMRKMLFAAAALVALGAVPAYAADAVGRISYIYPDGHRLILDANKTYSVASSVNMKGVGVAEFVRLGLAGDTVTAISPGPPALAAYWTSADESRSS